MKVWQDQLTQLYGSKQGEEALARQQAMQAENNDNRLTMHRERLAQQEAASLRLLEKKAELKQTLPATAHRTLDEVMRIDSHRARLRNENATFKQRLDMEEAAANKKLDLDSLPAEEQVRVLAAIRQARGIQDIHMDTLSKEYELREAMERRLAVEASERKRAGIDADMAAKYKQGEELLRLRFTLDTAQELLVQGEKFENAKTLLDTRIAASALSQADKADLQQTLQAARSADTLQTTLLRLGAKVDENRAGWKADIDAATAKFARDKQLIYERASVGMASRVLRDSLGIELTGAYEPSTVDKAKLAEATTSARRGANYQADVTAVNSTIGEKPVAIFKQALGATPGEIVAAKNTAMDEETFVAMRDAATFFAAAPAEMLAPIKVFAELPNDYGKQQFIIKHALETRTSDSVARAQMASYLQEVQGAISGPTAANVVAEYYGKNGPARPDAKKRYKELEAQEASVRSTGAAAAPSNSRALAQLEAMRADVIKANSANLIERATVDWSERQYKAQADAVETHVMGTLLPTNAPAELRAAHARALEILKTEPWDSSYVSLLDKMVYGMMRAITNPNATSFLGGKLIGDTYRPTGITAPQAADIAQRVVNTAMGVIDQKASNSITKSGWNWQVAMQAAAQAATRRPFFEAFGFTGTLVAPSQLPAPATAPSTGAR
jgi:hypothetical protein